MLNKLKNIGWALLFPHTVLFCTLVPVAAALLIYVFVAADAHPVLAYGAYFFSAYALTVVCARMPGLFKRLKAFKDGNKYINLYTADPRLRVKLSLYTTVSMNSLYALMQLGSGIHYGSFWFYSLAVYYALLAVMRFFLLRDTKLQEPVREWKRFRFCGVLLLVMNLALAGMVFFIVRFERGFEYSFILTIAMATFTFFSVIKSVINVIKYRRYESPVLSAAKAIGLASALVSLLSLETAMFAAFGTGEDPALRRTMTALTGAVVCAFVLVMALYMIGRSTKEIKKSESNYEQKIL